MLDAFYFPVFYFLGKKEEDAAAFSFYFSCKMGTSSCIQTILAVVQPRGKWKCRSSSDVLDPQYRKREEMEENRKRNRLSVNKFSYLTGPEISLHQREGEILGQPNRVRHTPRYSPPFPLSTPTAKLTNDKQIPKSKIRQTELRSCLTPIPPGCNSHHMK